MGCYGLFVLRHWLNQALWSTEPSSYTSLHSLWWSLSVYRYSWLPACACDYELCSGFAEFASWPYLIKPLLPSVVCCSNISLLFWSFKIHMNYNPSAITSGAVPVVLLAIWLRIDQHTMLALSDFYYPGSAGKIQFSRERLEILTHLSQICEKGRVRLGSIMILLNVKFKKWEQTWKKR